MCALPKWLSAGFYDCFALFTVRTRALPLQRKETSASVMAAAYDLSKYVLPYCSESQQRSPSRHSNPSVSVFCSLLLALMCDSRQGLTFKRWESIFHHATCAYEVLAHTCRPQGARHQHPHPSSYLLQLDHACLWQHTTLPCAANRWSALDRGCRPPHIARSCYKMDTLDV